MIFIIMLFVLSAHFASPLQDIISTPTPTPTRFSYSNYDKFFVTTFTGYTVEPTITAVVASATATNVENSTSSHCNSQRTRTVSAPRPLETVATFEKPNIKDLSAVDKFIYAGSDMFCSSCGMFCSTAEQYNVRVVRSLVFPSKTAAGTIEAPVPSSTRASLSKLDTSILAFISTLAILGPNSNSLIGPLISALSTALLANFGAEVFCTGRNAQRHVYVSAVVLGFFICLSVFSLTTSTTEKVPELKCPHLSSDDKSSSTDSVSPELGSPTLLSCSISTPETKPTAVEVIQPETAIGTPETEPAAVEVIQPETTDIEENVEVETREDSADVEVHVSQGKPSGVQFDYSYLAEREIDEVASVIYNRACQDRVGKTIDSLEFKEEVSQQNIDILVALIKFTETASSRGVEFECSEIYTLRHKLFSILRKMEKIRKNLDFNFTFNLERYSPSRLSTRVMVPCRGTEVWLNICWNVLMAWVAMTAGVPERD